LAAPAQRSIYIIFTWFFSDFQGHNITAKGVLPILKHVQAIQDFPFFRGFIPAAANMLLPLMDALRAD
jgi:hypothetical protein